MSFNSILLRLAILPLIITVGVSCTSFGVAIPLIHNFSSEKIIQLPQQQQESLVSVRGKVTHLAPFVTGGAYRLEDDSAGIWVVTEQILPNQGEEIEVKAQVKYQNIPIGESDLGEFYLLELSKKSVIENNQSIRFEKNLNNKILPDIYFWEFTA